MAWRSGINGGMASAVGDFYFLFIFLFSFFFSFLKADFASAQRGGGDAPDCAGCRGNPGAPAGSLLEPWRCRDWGEPSAVLLQCRGIVRDAAASPGLDLGENKQS